MTGYLEESHGGLEWGVDLIPGVLIKRYKRFLADVRLEDGTQVTAHTPNTGSMAGCSDPGWPVWLSPHDDPHRKLKFTWELVKAPSSLVGINTGVPNRLVKAAAAAGKIEELVGYESHKAEIKVNAHTRLDLIFKEAERRTCYIEIKNCTLVEKDRAFFPDAVTTRGAKHLETLAELAQQGARAVIFFLVQRMDAKVFSPADHIDPEYGRLLRRVSAQGVEVLAYDVAIDRTRIDIRRRVPLEI